MACENKSKGSNFIFSARVYSYMLHTASHLYNTMFRLDISGGYLVIVHKGIVPKEFLKEDDI